MASTPVDDTKARLRISAHAARADLSQEYRAKAAHTVVDVFLQAIHLGTHDIVVGYWPIRDELDCGPLLARLMDQQQAVGLPVVIGAGLPLELRLWEQGAGLESAGFGTFAPSAEARRVEPDLMLVPLLGFDARGTRLGYGGGFYDRTFAKLARKPRMIGLAFSAQEVSSIPREDHDVPLDAVITETGLRMFGDRQ